MDYKTRTRVALMKGTAHRTKGQGISYVGGGSFMDLMHDTGALPRGSGAQMSGTISHRVIRDLAEPLSESMNDLSIKKKVRGQGITRKKIYDDEGTTRKTKGSGFKPLKFNF